MRAAVTKENPRGRARPVHSESAEAAVAQLSRSSNSLRWALLGLIVVVFGWSYWPVLMELVDQWRRIPDYSHGFLVIPLAGYFLWARRESFPGLSANIAWLGLLLILVSAALRLAGARYYLTAFHGWSIPFWLGGVVWMFLGWRSFKWALPAILFLFFMVPIPYSIETMLSHPLQRISTMISLFLLQCLGQPAVAEGTTIVVGSYTLEIERACSGLRIFFGIAALAFAYIVLFPRPLWIRLMLVLAILPIALVSNSLRIVATGLLFRSGMGEAARHLSHDMAGWVMIPVAAGLFAMMLWYLDRLFPAVAAVDPSVLVRQQTQNPSPAG